MTTSKIKIETLPNGPYRVDGGHTVTERFIMPNAEGSSHEYQKGQTWHSPTTPMYLCRCGRSRNKPFCDGEHTHEPTFDGTTTAPHESVTDNAHIHEGPNFTLIDKEMLCAFARFCDAFGGVWQRVREGTAEGDSIALNETHACPSGRLVMIDNQTGRIIEERTNPEIQVLEDPSLALSGPLYAKGGITVTDDKGIPYEPRNRQTLCRCGQSRNKPFCDGTHATQALGTPKKRT